MRDFTKEIYANLPFLNSGMHFFAAYDLIPPEKMPPIEFPSVLPAYGILPDGRMLKLGAIGDITKLGMRIRSGRQALQLARFITD